MGDIDRASRCITMLAALDAELHWRLSGEAREHYAAEVLQLLPAICSDALLRRVIVNYHADSALVKALSDQSQPEHDAAWSSWMRQVLRILRSAGLAWSSDGAMDADDLLQVAQLELARALPSFRYTSRFSTWAYQVVVQSVRRELRNSQAKKRSTRPDSLDAMQAVAVALDDKERLETLVASRLLAHQALDILSQHTDPRLQHIFQLCVIADMRPEDVAPLLTLHPSRIRALLHEACQTLQTHVAMQAWRTDEAYRAVRAC